MKRFIAGVVIGMLIGTLGLAGAQQSSGRSLFFLPQSTNTSGFITGNTFQDWIDGKNQSGILHGWANGYVAGVVDTLMVAAFEADFVAEGNSLPGFFNPAYWNDIDYDRKMDIARAFTLLRAKLATSSLNGIVVPQVTDVVAKYIQDHPAERHNNAALLVWRALAEAEWR